MKLAFSLAFFLGRLGRSKLSKPGFFGEAICTRWFRGRPPPLLRGSKIEKIQDLPPGLYIFQVRLKISSEPPTKALFLWVGGGGIVKVEIEIFKRD